MSKAIVDLPVGDNLLEKLAQLVQIAQDLTRAMPEPEMLLQTTIQRTVGLFHVTRGAIVLYENDHGIVVASYDTRGDKASSATGNQLTDSPFQQIVQNSDGPILLPDVDRDDRLTEDERAGFGAQNVKSSMILPLIARGRVIGSLGLDQCDDTRKFTCEEQELAEILADLAAIAIDNARLYGVAEEELSEIIRIARNLVSDASNPDIQLDTFFRTVMQQTLNLLRFDVGWLLLREGNRVRIVAADDMHLQDIGRAFEISDCISGLSVLEKRVINLSDLDNISKDYRKVYKAPIGSVGEKRMKSELVVPLSVGENAIGAFNIESDRQHAFGPHHEQMLSLLSEHVALAIELAKSRAEANALDAISRNLARTTSIREVMSSILSNAFDLIGGGFGQVLLREGDELVVRWTTNDPPNDLDMRVNIGNSVVGLAVQERKPVIVEDVDEPNYWVIDLHVADNQQAGTAAGQQAGTAAGQHAGRLVERQTKVPRYQRVLEAEKARMQAELAVPVWFQDRIIGVLNLETANKGGFSEQQRADVLDLVKQNAQRFAQGLKNGDQDLGQLLRNALARAETDFGQILRVDGSELAIETTSGAERVGTRVEIGQSVTGKAVQEARPVYIPDVNLEPSYQRFLGKEMKSELAVPMLVEDRVIGALNVESPVPAFFAFDQARILNRFAGYAAIAIDRAQTFAREMQAEIGDLAGDIVHRLNNPLGALKTRLELLERRESYTQWITDSPYLARFVERTARDLNSAQAITRELRDKLKGRELASTPLQPAILAALAQAELPGTIRVDLYLGQDAVNVTATDRLTNVFWNLFDNSNKAMQGNGTLSVKVREQNGGPWITVQITDTGKGIEPWRLDSIFDVGESTTQDASGATHGLGLWWVRTQIERFGGQIEVQSEPNVGTTMIVRLKRVT